MKRRSGLAGTGSKDPKEHAPSTGKRFGFTVAKDIALLKSTLQHNPFQLGPKKWADVAEELKLAFKDDVSERTCKERVLRLKNLYESQQLTFKTGTEEERSERGVLVQNVIEIYEESVAPIDAELGADEMLDATTPDASSTTPNPKKQQRDERIQADKDRDKLVNDMAPDPPPKRKKQRLMPEDELIKMKMEHDMKVEDDRLKLEEEKLRKDHEMESKKLDLEMRKFEFEQKKEERLAEENKRKDDLARMQMGVQEQLLKVLAKLTEK